MQSLFPILQNPDSVILLIISTVLILLAIFSSRIHKISVQQHPNNISCPQCLKKISRSNTDNKTIICPFCLEKLVLNQKRLIYLYLGVIILGLSLFLEKELRWLFQLIYVILISIGITMKKFEKAS